MLRMMMSSGIMIHILYTAVLGLCIILYLIIRTGNKPANSAKSPPGPNGFPLLGNLFDFLGERPHLQFYKMAREFGSIFRVRLGGTDVIALNDFSTIREATNKHKEIKRYMAPVNNLLHKIGRKFKRDEASLDEQFKDVKRIFGSPTSDLEICASKETEQTVKNIHKKGSDAFYLKPLVLATVVNTTLNVFNVNRCHLDDVRIKNTAEFSKNLIKVDQYFQILDVFPIFNIFKIRQFKTVAFLGLKLQNFVNEKMRELSKNGSKLSESYIKHDEERDNEMNYKFNSVQSISCTLRNSLIAGTHTVTNTFNIAMYFIVQNPTIMDKVQKEIDIVTGGQRRPSYADRTNLPYTEATIAEILRISRLVVRKYCAPNGGSLGGYSVCPGSMVLINYYALHHNPDVYPDPDQFRPERFLDAEGKFSKPREYIPFGTGSRMCKGVGLARVDLFILFTYLLQSFTFALNDNTKHNLEGILGYNEEFSYQVRATPRQTSLEI